ncbi:ABC transporter permease [Desulfosarcina ovata]|uniref:Iron(III) ABC transporter permease n=1 Tax=Desulfosarcina ovata subsp. ovata TaxID=2752305 RepID=A0A5K8A588_9BACT|nr:iron ABC transporter permease [Desulfosarcina ovata]BBO87534.1 iron(III) ABC transporter permease [Desulfosarcina ovata subsp. ovata]
MAPPRLFTWAVIGTFVGIALLPLLYMVLTPFLGGDAPVPLGDTFELRHLTLAGKSLLISFGTALAALVIGAGLAFLITKTDMPGRRWLGHAFILPLLIPPYIHAIVWAHLSPWFLSNLKVDLHSIVGVMIVLTLAYFPFVTLTTMAGLKSIDRSKEEAALMVHKPIQMLGRVTVPLCLPNMLSGAVFVFVFAIINVGVPDILRVRVYPLEIFIQFSAFFDTWKATLLSLPMIFLTVALIVAQRWTMGDRSYVHLGAGENAPVVFRLGRTGGLLLLVCGLLVGCAFFVPVITLLIKSGGFDAYTRVLSTSAKPIFLSFFIAAGAAVLITLLGGSLGYLQQRLAKPSRRFLSLLVFIPFAVPATTMGIGLIGVWNRSCIGWIYGSLTILIIAHMARFIPYAAAVAHAGVGQVGTRLEEAAWLSGAGFLSVLSAIVARLTRRHLVVAAFIVFILAFGELGTTLLVSPPGVETVPVKIYNLMHYGAEEMVAALCIIMMTIIFLISSAFLWVLRK